MNENVIETTFLLEKSDGSFTKPEIHFLTHIPRINEYVSLKCGYGKVEKIIHDVSIKRISIDLIEE